jgi:hypothetical protein
MELVISRQALEEARTFFEEAGSRGAEGTGALAGPIVDGTHVARRLVIPDQVARADFGCSVEVTTQGKLELASRLGPKELYVARIHSHPGDAFHSSVDNRNPFLTADGAWSIVVPYFGLGLRRGLAACSLYRFTSGRWVEVPKEAVARVVQVKENV